MRTVKPLRHANHQIVVTTLALLALDHPEHQKVFRSLVVTLYGPSLVPVYEAVRRTFVPIPPAEAVAVLE